MPAATASTLGCATWSAFASSVVLRVADPGALAAARAEVEAELAAIDLACSRFREDSELTRLNRRAGGRVAVSPLLMEALELALRAARLSDGDVDPTIGRALELAGYDRDWAEPRRAPARAQPLRLRARPGWTAVALDPVTATVRLPHGVRLDLGATAKAWAADRAARAAARAASGGALVAIGGDVATAGAAPAGGWRVHVTDDHRSPASAPGQTVAIRSGGLATSSTTVRRWRRETRGRLPWTRETATMHHILDPRTGAPARTPWRTASVAAASCAEANIASTAALVRGEAAPSWLARLGLPARLVARDGATLRVGAWPVPAQERET